MWIVETITCYFQHILLHIWFREVATAGLVSSHWWSRHCCKAGTGRLPQVSGKVWQCQATQTPQAVPPDGRLNRELYKRHLSASGLQTRKAVAGLNTLIFTHLRRYLAPNSGAFEPKVYKSGRWNEAAQLIGSLKVTRWHGVIHAHFHITALIRFVLFFA